MAARVNHRAKVVSSVAEGLRLRQSPPVEMRREREQPWCGEVAGGTASELASMCCCFPCAVVELVILAMVRAPAVLCHRAIRVGRSRRLAARVAAATRKEMEELLTGHASPRSLVAVDKAKKTDVAKVEWPVTPVAELSEVEKEVWASFYGAGFWRSQSQRENRW